MHRPRIAVLVYSLLALAFVAPGLGPGRVLLPLDLLNDLGAWKADETLRVPVSNRLLSDAVLQFEPWLAHARRTLLEGRVPWVNQQQGLGEPFWANPQTALLSPFSWPMLVFGAGGWAWSVLLRVLVAGLGGRALALAMGASPGAALLSGTVYALCGYSIVWGLHPASSVSAFLPWLAASLLKILREPSSRAVSAVVLFAAAAAAGGHPETLFHGALGIGAFLIWETAAARSDDAPGKRSGARRLALASSAAAAGILLLGIVHVPFLGLLGESRTRELRQDRAPLPFRGAAVAAQVLPGFLGSPLKDELDLTALDPRAENFNERTGGYVGAITLLVLALAFRRLAAPFRRGLFVGGISLLVAWRVPFLEAGLRKLPLFSMAANERLVLVFALFASAAAGPAVEALSRRTTRSGAGLVLVAVGLLLAGAGIAPSFDAMRPRLIALASRGVESLRASGVLRRPPEVYATRLSEYLAAGRRTALRRLAFPGLCFVAAGLAIGWRGRLTSILGGALVAELAGTGWGYLPAVPVSAIPGEPEAIRDVRRLDPQGTGLLIAGPGIYPPDLATLHRVRDVRSYDALSGPPLKALVSVGYDESLMAFPGTPSGDAIRLLASLGVRFYLSREPLPGMTRVGGSPPPRVGVYESAGAAPMPVPANRPPHGLAAGAAVSAGGVLLAVAAALFSRSRGALSSTATPP